MYSTILTPNKLIKNEIHTLTRIASSPILKKDFKQLVYNAQDYLSRNKKTIQRNNFTEFIFESVIDNLDIDGKPGVVAHVGAEIKTNRGKYDQLTYYLALCDDKQFIRKFHFDFAPKDNTKRTPQPIFHLQYPGELSNHLVSLDLQYEHLFTELSEPRIPYTPMSLALIMNLIFKEFPNEQTHRATEDTTWRDLIKTNENLLLAPYYKTCNRFFTQPPARTLFTSDFCYGK